MDLGRHSMETWQASLRSQPTASPPTTEEDATRTSRYMSRDEIEDLDHLPSFIPEERSCFCHLFYCVT